MFRSYHYPLQMGGRRGSDMETLAKIFFLITTPPSGGTDLDVVSVYYRHFLYNSNSLVSLIFFMLMTALYSVVVLLVALLCSKVST